MATMDARPSGGEALLSRPTVLIVDDAEPVQRKLVALLARLGIPPAQVRLAGDPDAALAAIAAEPPSLILAEFLGVHPDEGLDLIHAMLDKAPDTRLVLLTSEPLGSDEVRAALRAGAFAFVPKPIRQDKLQLVLEEAEADEGRVVRLR